MQRWISLICVVIILLTFSACNDGNMTSTVGSGKEIKINATQNISGEYILAAENSKVALYVVSQGRNSGCFFVENKSDSSRLYSNPLADNSNEGKDVKPEIYSQFLLNVINPKTGTVKKVNSYTGSSSGKYVKVDLSAEGFTAAYSLKNYDMSVSLM